MDFANISKNVMPTTLSTPDALTLGNLKGHGVGIPFTNIGVICDNLILCTILHQVTLNYGQ